MPASLHPGLYAITDEALATGHALSKQVAHALQGGAKVIQYRDKSDDQKKRRREATELLQLCKNYQVPLIINDDIALAADIGADGVHLGKEDSQLTEARTTLGDQAIIGISCYNNLELAQTAEARGASYVAFGRFFPSQSKPHATHADLTTLRKAKEVIDIPIVAIGGITPENGGELVAAGADMLAVIHAVFGQPDITAACQRFNSLFD
ncbi:MAG: thiamine phosphate synthase [Chromatiales bacterium]|nr:thiamine phosphate synthase [Chromatiales bacterium]